MDIERYKKFALNKINEGDITKNVKKVIKSEKYKEQNYREGISRKNLSNLRDLITDVNTNRNKYGFKDSIIDNLEMLNYNILRLINRGVAPRGVAPPEDPPLPPPPPFNIPPPPPPPPFNDGFPPPPPPNLFDNDNQEDDVNPTLPPPLPPFPSSEPLTRIVTSARENLLEEIRNPKKLKPTPKEPTKNEISFLDEIRNPKKLKSKEQQKPLKKLTVEKTPRENLLEEIKNPKKLKTTEQQESKKNLSLNEDFMINTFNKFMEGRRRQIEQSTDEDEDEDYWD